MHRFWIYDHTLYIVPNSYGHLQSHWIPKWKVIIVLYYRKSNLCNLDLCCNAFSASDSWLGKVSPGDIKPRVS